MPCSQILLLSALLTMHLFAILLAVSLATQDPGTSRVELCRVGEAHVKAEGLSTTDQHVRMLSFGDDKTGIQTKVVCKGGRPPEGQCPKCKECPCEFVPRLNNHFKYARVLLEEATGAAVAPDNTVQGAPETCGNKDVLMIGGGGGLVPSLFRTICPDGSMAIVEVDASVAALATDMFGLKVDGRSVLHVDDGLRFVKRSAAVVQPGGTKGKIFDAIMVDCFDSDAGHIPAGCASAEFVQAAYSLLKPGGKLIQHYWKKNVPSQSPAALLGLYHKTFHAGGDSVRDASKEMSSDSNDVVVGTRAAV